ncbi:3-deoxy-D-manno-octulosonic acid kinase [Marilutibacter alkalisoli]|uniref:3-deoxy-D-manno-octulosonic acid kinase n=1 Tax=Marilutibacter alkalisoli TaxID=2591633 RepID=A0A514BU23_9GAMM|nr:3-deoxy-D-manno-octulosonic acid kinase [Lysobacter alkalisoli]QDH70539.1 3-deoxy-D-manno-octulosonic acid kinase [Lysobacter alkalisoli]
MTGYDATEGLTPFRDDGGYGAILFDLECLRQAGMRQVGPEWFSPQHWGERARPVDSGGRGGAWFVDTPVGPAVLRRYLRGGLAAKLSHDSYLWHGANRTRSFAEFRLTRAVARRGLPVPRPIAAYYRRVGLRYEAAILLDRIDNVASLADHAVEAADAAPWEDAGRLVAKTHRVGLDHADLNAHNLLFNGTGKGWVIDLDRGALRIPATGWRERNLKRLRRSLLKLRGERPAVEVERDYQRLRQAYDAIWARGY